MANVSISLNSEVREMGEPVRRALQLLADAVEGYFAYRHGDPDKCEQNYEAMQWGANYLSGFIAAERPTYEFGYSKEQDAELWELFVGPPYPPYTPYGP